MSTFPINVCSKCTFFLIQQLQHLGFDITIMLMSFLFCISSPFLYCYYGEMATGSYEKMADLLFGCNWQQLPLDLQKFFVLMIGNMQRPLYYHGFGVTVLNLETFLNVNLYYHNSTDFLRHIFVSVS